MKLKKLILGLDLTNYNTDLETEITNIQTDSRKVSINSLFVALKGFTNDGNDYIDQARKQKAAIIITSNLEIAKAKNCLYSQNIEEILPILLKRLYNKKPTEIIAITGTNGKTSTAYFAYQIACNLGKKAGYIGTIGVIAKDENISVTHDLTSPDIVTMHQILYEMAEKNVEFVAIEASSHGLFLGRLEGLEIKAGSFTNFSQDHLDFHHNMEEYFAAKMLLFTKVIKPHSHMIINKSLEKYSRLEKIAEERNINLITYGTNDSDLKILEFTQTNKGIKVKIAIFDFILEKDFDFIGFFQIENLLCAVGNFIALGYGTEEIVNALNNLKAPPGRMELVTHNGFPSVIIDYSHKPVALEKALLTCKDHLNDGALWLVFGCGGDRDKTKRRPMGEIADKIADYVIITDDNPRNEDATQIREEIAAGCKKAIIIGDRGEAISYSIKNAKVNDIILIAGKGHEDYQIIGDIKHKFSDLHYATSVMKKI